MTEALNTADNRKRDTYEEVCADSGYQFSPFARTTLGGFSVGAKWSLTILLLLSGMFMEVSSSSTVHGLGGGLSS